MSRWPITRSAGGPATGWAATYADAWRPGMPPACRLIWPGAPAAGPGWRRSPRSTGCVTDRTGSATTPSPPVKTRQRKERSVTGAGTLGSVPATSSSAPGRGPSMRDRAVALVREVGKFGTVGGIAFLIDLAIYNVLLQLGLETLIAKTISTVIATTFAFLGNRFWTWRDRAHHH